MHPPFPQKLQSMLPEEKRKETGTGDPTQERAMKITREMKWEPPE